MNKEVVVPIHQKYYKIYKKTKSKRIKNKQLKRFPNLQIRIEIEKIFSKNISSSKDSIKVFVNGKKMEKITNE